VAGTEFTGGEVGVWAVKDSPAWGPIQSLNETAMTYSPWGEAARPGSQADEVRALLLSYP